MVRLLPTRGNMTQAVPMMGKDLLPGIKLNGLAAFHSASSAAVAVAVAVAAAGASVALHRCCCCCPSATAAVEEEEQEEGEGTRRVRVVIHNLRDMALSTAAKCTRRRQY